MTHEGQLHTLVLAKASIVCWEAEYQDEDLAQEFEEVGLACETVRRGADIDRCRGLKRRSHYPIA